MADDSPTPYGLTISGGGSTAVASASLFDQSRRLSELVDDLEWCSARLAAIDLLVSVGQLQDANARYRAFTAEKRIADAGVALRMTALTARALIASLAAAAEGYGAVERFLQQLGQTLAAKFSYALGILVPGLMLLFGPAVASTALSAGAAYLSMSDRRKAEWLRWLAEQNDVLTDPRMVTLVRLGVMSADDFAAGLARVNPHLVAMLGDEGIGLLGLTSTAGAVIGMVAPTGALAETPVRVRRVSTRQDEAVADSFRERAARIPRGNTQIRIDRYHTDGEPDRFEVYLGGTKDLSLTATDEPWDMTSNVNTLSMGDAGSYRAAQEAMRMAGVTADSPVVFAGHSQGGLVGSALAGSGQYNAQGLFTVGGVVSQNLVAEGVPWLAIEHTDDLVPALGGNRSAPEAVLVRRQAFAGVDIPSDTVLPAHELSRYRQTAALVDASADGRSGAVLAHLNRMGVGTTTVTTTRYLASRVPDAGR